ncbi:MAG: TMEM14 family protein [Verrucomicrobiota bacterium]
MTLQFLGRWFLGFGAFLIVCGVLGFLSNPEKAKTALMSGGTFGLLSIGWGFWILKGGRKVAWIAAAGTTLLLIAAFTWRSIASWQAYFAGEPKLIAAVLITAMWIGSAASLVVLMKTRSLSFGAATS